MNTKIAQKKFFFIVPLLVIIVIGMQFFFWGGSGDVGIPFRFLTMEVGKNLPASALGEIYSPKIHWSGLVLNIIVYSLISYSVIRMLKKSRRTKK